MTYSYSPISTRLDKPLAHCADEPAERVNDFAAHGGTNLVCGVG